MIKKCHLTYPGTSLSISRYLSTYDILFGIELEMKFRKAEEASTIYHAIFDSRTFSDKIFNIEFDRDVAGFIKRKDEDGVYCVHESDISIVRGFEVVMRPMSASQLSYFNKLFIKLFKENKCYPQITSCHTHISAHWMSEKFIITLYDKLYSIQKYMVNKYQPIFHNTFEGGYRAKRRHHAIKYLKQMPEYVYKSNEKGIFFDFLFDGCDPSDITKYNNNRYTWVNFVSLFLYGTLEVRLPETMQQSIEIIKDMLKIFQEVSGKIGIKQEYGKTIIKEVKEDYYNLCMHDERNIINNNISV